jgi:hypothetical protein
LAKAEINDEMVEQLSEAIDGCLRLICPAILEEEKPVSILEKLSKKGKERHPFSFEQKTQVLEFYSNEVFQPVLTKNPAKNPIGARRSHG